MTRIQSTDPLNFPTQARENKGKAHRAGKGVVLAIASIGMIAFVAYMALIVISATQS